MRRILANGTLVTPEGLRRADLALEGGRIAEIAAHIAPGLTDVVEDVGGCWVFPGFIDAHTHLQCWTGMDWTADSFETGTRAAACGGTTCIVDYATADRGVTMDEALAEWHKRAEDGAGCTANYGFHMAIAEWGEDSPEQMRRMREEGVSSFKTYLAYDHLRLSDAETLRCLEVVRDLDAVLCVHCENGDVVNELQRRVLAAGITGGELLLKNCPFTELESVIAKLESMGLAIEQRPEGVLARYQGVLRGADVKTRPYPGFPTDMQAQIMALMCLAEGSSMVEESIFENRFMHVLELVRMGADIKISGHTAMVRGVSRLTGAPVMASDLRASASLVLAGLAAHGTTHVQRIYHLDRGYERIENKLNAVGARIRREKE